MPLPKLELIRTANGSFFVLPTDTIIAHTLRTYGGFEPQLCQLAVEVLRRRGRPGLLVDIGAHIGTFSIPVCLATGCNVMAFEAQRVIGQLLNANFVLNGIDRATIHHVILAAPGHAALASIPKVDYLRPGNFGAYSVDDGLFRQISLPRMQSLAGTESVPMRTLDDYLLDDVAMMKVDVEGQELDVLQGAVNTLERNHFPPLLFEAWRDDWWAEKKRELTQFVKSLGYEISALDENFFAQHRSASRSAA